MTSAPSHTPTVTRAASLTPAARRLSVRVTALCWLLVLFDGLDLFVYGAVLPRMLGEHSLGLTAARAGEIGSLTTFGMLIGALTSGMISDRVGRRAVLMCGVTLFSLASAGCALAPDATMFGMARFFAGLGLGGLLPTAIAMVMEYAPPTRRHLTVTVVMTAHQFGGAVAGGLAVFVVDAFGWRSVFWLGALPLLAVPVLALVMPESIAYLLATGQEERADRLARRHHVALDDLPHARPGQQGLAGFRALLTPALRTTTLLFWAGSFAGLLLVYGVSTWLPTMMRAAGYDLGSAVGFLVVINLGGIVGLLVAGRLADRFSARPVAVVWFLLTAAGIGLLAVHLPLAVTYLVVFLTGSWLFSAQTLIYTSVGVHYPTASRATALGWVAGIGRFGAVFGPALGGFLVGSGLSRWGFVAFAVAALFGSAMVALARPRVASSPSGSAPGESLT